MCHGVSKSIAGNLEVDVGRVAGSGRDHHVGNIGVFTETEIGVVADGIPDICALKRKGTHDGRVQDLSGNLKLRVLIFEVDVDRNVRGSRKNLNAQRQ